MSNLVDRYLLYRIRTKRDPQAFGKLYDRYVTSLYRFVLLKVPSKEDAEDLTAETFTKTWNYLQGHEPIEHFRAFLYRSARNAIADFYRRRPEHLTFESLSVTSDDLSASTSIERPREPHDHGREGQIIEARAELSIIVRQLSQLKDDYRDVLTLRLVDDLAFEDIAAILEKKTGHVRVIYHRGLKALNDLNTP